MDKTNIETLRLLLLEKKVNQPEVVDRSAIYIPVGYDAYDIIRDTIVVTDTSMTTDDTVDSSTDDDNTVSVLDDPTRAFEAREGTTRD